MTDKRTILVTSALPYANGSIHIGHLVEYLQTDFWVRFQKMRGHDCHYFCADDTHGTPIMLRARQEGIDPEELIARSHAEHIKDFTDFEIAFDNYFSTHDPINRELSNELFFAMEKNEHLDIRSIDQSYCETCAMFLPDRFVKGRCPKCDAEDQYGDSCEVCSSTYSPVEMGSPYCVTCNNPPVVRASEHLFFRLNDFKDWLAEWVPAHTSRDTANKMMEWFDEDLRDWCISRDEPYFGFEIPGHPGKFFYVWVDAPVGYMASAKDWCAREGRDFDSYWNGDATEIYHFIGKDIVRFHSLFWPAMLKNGGKKTPEKIFVHGFLTVNGEKMSKTRGTFINARTFLTHLEPLYLRFYYACKLNATADDMDLSFEDFINRVNSDLVGKITNLASRGAQMLHKKLDGRAGTMDDAGREIYEAACSRSEHIAQLYEQREFSKVLVEVREIADQANRYFDEQAPWVSMKEDPESGRPVLTSILNIFRVLSIYLKPVLPSYVAKVEALFGEDPYQWSDMNHAFENREVAPYEYLAQRIDQAAVDAVVEDTRAALAPGG